VLPSPPPCDLNRPLPLISCPPPPFLSPQLFLYLAFQNIHWPLEAPQSYIDKYANATGGDVTRQMVCAMINFLDDAIGNVTAALARAGLVEDTTIIFSSDNGGPTHGDEGTSSNNFPLRGGKNTLWEGGTRVVGIVRGAGITATNYVSFEKVHATDWLPTLVTMASGRNWTDFVSPDEPPYLLGDGVNVWDTLASGAPSPRDWLLLETHPPNATDRIHGDGLTVGDWKLLKVGSEMLAHADEDGWYPPPGEDPNTTNYSPIKCAPPPPGDNAPDPQECVKDWCLFNVTADPCEYDNVAAANPDVVATLKARLAAFSATAVPPVAPSGCVPVIQTLPNGAKVWATCGP
jgi:arylsulfatase B